MSPQNCMPRIPRIAYSHAAPRFRLDRGNAPRSSTRRQRIAVRQTWRTQCQARHNPRAFGKRSPIQVPTPRYSALTKSPEKIHRRTLYTFIKRTAPAPQMGTFDAPPRESCVVVRERTNTPLQALLILNDPQYVEAARGLAERVMKSKAESPANKAATMFRLAAGRSATDEEVIELVESYQRELKHFQDNPEAAKQLTAVGAIPPSEELNRMELAAWTLTANLILNLDEVVTKN